MSDELIQIHPATQEDLSGIRDVAFRTWRATYGGVIPDSDINAFLERTYSIHVLTRRLEPSGAEHGHILLVARQADKVIGYATAGINQDDAAEIFSIYVIPELQGTGVGWRLWRRVAEFLADLGFDEFVVWMLDSNERMRRFCERQGGVLEGERPYTVADRVVAEVGYRAPTGRQSDLTL